MKVIVNAALDTVKDDDTAELAATITRVCYPCSSGISARRRSRRTANSLRKACITDWANHISNPEVVRKLAGHSDIKTPMQYYSQVTEEQRREAAEVMDKLLEMGLAVESYAGRLILVRMAFLTGWNDSLWDRTSCYAT